MQDPQPYEHQVIQAAYAWYKAYASYKINTMTRTDWELFQEMEMYHKLRKAEKKMRKLDKAKQAVDDKMTIETIIHQPLYQPEG